jgi:hypothetical protein
MVGLLPLLLLLLSVVVGTVGLGVGEVAGSYDLVALLLLLPVADAESRLLLSLSWGLGVAALGANVFAVATGVGMARPLIEVPMADDMLLAIALGFVIAAGRFNGGLMAAAGIGARAAEGVAAGTTGGGVDANGDDDDAIGEAGCLLFVPEILLGNGAATLGRDPSGIAAGTKGLS